MTHRRNFTAELKARVMLELLSGAKSAAELCRAHQIASSVLADWKAIFLGHAPSVFASPEPRHSQEAMHVAELERLTTAEVAVKTRIGGHLSGGVRRPGRPTSS